MAGYLHKTVVAAEFMLINILRRAKKIVAEGKEIFASPALKFFLENDITTEDFKNNPKVLETFAKLDDFDITSRLKSGRKATTKYLRCCPKAHQPRIAESRSVQNPDFGCGAECKTSRSAQQIQTDGRRDRLFVYAETLTNNAYNQTKQNISLLLKNGEVQEVSQASDNLNISALATPVEKYCFCYPA